MLSSSDSCLPDPDRPQRLSVIPDRPQQLGAIPDRLQKLDAIPDHPQGLGAISDRFYGQYDTAEFTQQTPLSLGRHTLDGSHGNRLLVIYTVLRRTLKSLRRIDCNS